MCERQQITVPALHFLNGASVLYAANSDVGAEILAVLILIIKHVPSDSPTFSYDGICHLGTLNFMKI